MPDGTNVTAAPVCSHIDNAMVKAIARAFRWRELTPPPPGPRY
jgi:hypothetical protein